MDVQEERVAVRHEPNPSFEAYSRQMLSETANGQRTPSAGTKAGGADQRASEQGHLSDWGILRLMAVQVYASRSYYHQTNCRIEICTEVGDG